MYDLNSSRFHFLIASYLPNSHNINEFIWRFFKMSKNCAWETHRQIIGDEGWDIHYHPNLWPKILGGRRSGVDARLCHAFQISKNSVHHSFLEPLYKNKLYLHWLYSTSKHKFLNYLIVFIISLQLQIGDILNLTFPSPNALNVDHCFFVKSHNYHMLDIKFGENLLFLWA